jgi:hypothetical protein
VGNFEESNTWHKCQDTRFATQIRATPLQNFSQKGMNHFFMFDRCFGRWLSVLVSFPAGENHIDISLYYVVVVAVEGAETVENLELPCILRLFTTPSLGKACGKMTDFCLVICGKPIFRLPKRDFNSKKPLFWFSTFFSTTFSLWKTRPFQQFFLFFHNFLHFSTNLIPHRIFLCETSILALFSTPLFWLSYAFSTHFSTGAENYVEK